MKILCKNLEEFSLGYAITVFKSQGSETDEVIFFYPNGDFYCKKNIKYVACSRPKAKLVILGDLKRFILNKEEFEKDKLDHFYLFDDMDELEDKDGCYFSKGEFIKNNSYLAGNKNLKNIDFCEIKASENVDHEIETSKNVDHEIYKKLKNVEIGDKKITQISFKKDDGVNICPICLVKRGIYRYKEKFICNECMPVDENDMTVCCKCDNIAVKNICCKNCASNVAKNNNKIEKNEFPDVKDTCEYKSSEKCIYCNEDIHFDIGRIMVLHKPECNPSTFTMKYEYENEKWELKSFRSDKHRTRKASKNSINPCNCDKCSEKDKPVNCCKCRKLFNQHLTGKKVHECDECR
jgi:hypothetical protein